MSNDNPYSEAWFKTFKYAPVFPEVLTDLAHARGFMDIFTDYYNTAHHHSGIGLYTPASVHDGTWKGIARQRQRILDDAYTTHPNRFRRRPLTPTPPKGAWINRPTITTIETQKDSTA